MLKLGYKGGRVPINKVVICHGKYKASVDRIVTCMKYRNVQARSSLKTKIFPTDTTQYINWGHPRVPQDNLPKSNILNRIFAVQVAGNKLKSFIALLRKGVQIPDFCLGIEEARAKVGREWGRVVSRKSLRGAQGFGIVIAATPAKVAAAPLYVQYIEKDSEYRVHVFLGRVLLAQEKLPISNATKVNYEVRNSVGGWGFIPEGQVEIPEEAKLQAIAAVAAVGLDFGAVDIIREQGTGEGRMGQWEGGDDAAVRRVHAFFCLL